MKMWCLMSLTLMGLGLTAAQAPTQAPRKCCFDREFTAVLQEQGGIVHEGHASEVEGTLRVAYDFYRKRIGSLNNVRQPDDSYVTSYILLDYESRLMYVSDAHGHNCQSSPLSATEQMYPPCIPNTATFLGLVQFGYGPETLDCNSWEFLMPGTDLVIKIVVTESCVPVVEAFYGHANGSYAEITYFIHDYHPGIENLHNLDPPANCNFTNTPSNNRPPVGRRFVKQR